VNKWENIKMFSLFLLVVKLLYNRNMLNNVKFMKKIMTKPYIQSSVMKYDNIYGKDPSTLISIKENVNRTHAYGNIKFNFFQLQCPSCSHSIKIPLTCKSRLCNKCGKIYSEKWTNKLTNSLLNVPHKHFKLVHRFGLYSKRILQKNKDIFEKFKTMLFKIPVLSLIYRILAYTGRHPFQCENALGL